MRRVYCRCNGGHYFVGEACPWDGWGGPELQQMAVESAILSESGREVSIEALREAGVRDDILRRTIVIDFGDGSASFDAMAIWRYMDNGSEVVMEGRGGMHTTINVPSKYM